MEQLLRENEKLRNDMKNSRRNMYEAGKTTNSYYGQAMGAGILNTIQNYQ